MEQQMPAPRSDVLLEHADFIRGIARSLLRDDYAADDVVQETMVAALRRPPRAGNLRGWLGKVARNLALTDRRGERRRRRREHAVSRAESLPSTDEGVARLELQRRVVEAVLALDEPYRSVIVHRFYYGLSLKAIAGRLDTPLETVRTRQRRALARLRGRLDGAHGGDRRAWSVVLLPLARPARAGALAGGVAFMSAKLEIAAGILVVVALAWLLPGLRDEPDAVPRSPVTAEATGTVGDEPLPAPPATVDFARVDRDLDLHGVVVDESGAPVANAAVRVVRYPYRDASWISLAALEAMVGDETVSSADGRFVLRLARGDEVDLRVEADGFAPIEWRHCQAGARVRVILPGHARLVVRAADPTGAPLPGVRVLLRKTLAMPYVEADGNLLGATRTTGADGTCVFERIAPGKGRHVLGWHPRFAMMPVDPFDLAAGDERRVDVGARPGRDVIGRVTDAATGAPIPGVVLCAYPLGILKRVVTDEDGRYVYAGWGAEDESALWAWPPEHAIASTAVGDTERVDFKLERGRRATGVLRDAGGEAVGDAFVIAMASVRRDGRQEIDVRQARSWGDGRFELRALRGDLQHVLVVVKPGFGRLIRDIPAPDPDGATDLGETVLPLACRFEGRVLDKAGHPLAGCKVTLESPGGAAAKSYGRRFVRHSDDLGRVRFNELAAGRYRLRLEGPRGRRIDRTVTVGLDAAEIELRFESKGTGVDVLVTDEAGQPVAGATVASHRRIRTDDTGHAHLDMPPGVYEAELFVFTSPTHPLLGSGKPIGWKRGDGEIHVVLKRAATLHGRVDDPDGRPYGPVHVHAESAGFRGSAAADAEGRFELRVPADQAVDLRTGRGRDGWVALVAERKAVAPGSKVVLRMRRIATDRTLRIRVVAPDGSGIGTVQVTHSPWKRQPSALPRTGPDGRLELANLPAIEMSVMLSLHPQEDAVERWAQPEPFHRSVVPDGQEIVFAFREANPVRGVVVRPDGSGVRAVVFGYRGERELVARALCQPDGTFRLNVAADEPGPLRIEASASTTTEPRMVVKSDLENVTPGADGVRLVLPEGGQGK